MPLKDFVDEAWEGLEAGKDDIPISPMRGWYDAIEPKRQEIMQGMIKAMSK